jgi:hypothetical protein
VVTGSVIGGNAMTMSTISTATLSVNSSTSIYNAGTLTVVNTNAIPAVSAAIIAPNMSLVGASGNLFVLGQATTQYNSMVMGWFSIGAGSTSNYLNINGYQATAGTGLNITAGGNIGIGKTNPSTILHLFAANNTITADWATSRANGNEYVSAGIDSYFLTRELNQNLGGFIRILDINTNGVYPTTVRGGAISFGTIDGNSGFSNPAVERMRITPTGNVGIGTAIPYGKLHVILTNAPTVPAGNTWTSGWAVFGDNTGEIAAGNGNGVGIAYNVTATVSLPAGGLLYSIAPNAAWNPMNYSASVHNFSISGSLTPALTINSSGNVGIGTNSPGGQLSLYSTTSLRDTCIIIKSVQPGIRFDGTLAGGGGKMWNIWEGFAAEAGNAGALITYNETNSVFVFILYPNGNATLAGALTQNSDIILKKNIEPVANGLSIISTINPVLYHFKTQSDSEYKHYGMIAQDVQKVLPNLVGESNEILTLNYIEFVPILISAVKEQNAIIKSQQAQIDSQKAQIDSLLAWAKTQGFQ